MVDKALFTSNRGDWETPLDLFDELDKMFGFTLDVCANAENAKCERYYTIEDDGLQQPWGPDEVIWCNPPYGKGIDKWLAKGKEAVNQGSAVVYLLPVRTDTKWFHDYCQNSATIRFLKGRLKFVGAPSSAPFPSMIVTFYPRAKNVHHQRAIPSLSERLSYR